MAKRNFLEILKTYDYRLPKELIARSPASPRDSARLLIYKRKEKKIIFDFFYNLPKYLPEHAVLVLNQTKVFPARLTLLKETGGKVQILYLERAGNYFKALANRNLLLNSKLKLTSKLYFTVADKKEKYYFLKPEFPIKKLGFIFKKYGKTPIPPYIKNSPLSEKELRQKYQSVFAKSLGSIAAPTASLHFTKKLLRKIKRGGAEIKFITLHVNQGTFAPLTKENWRTSTLHSEHYDISRKTADFLNKNKKSGRPIIAVGTTAMRALESAADKNGYLKKLSGATNIFIKTGYKFKFASGLITNFHVPKSSLLMLTAAFLKSRPKLLQLYKIAAHKKFRFFSFGDGMLIC